MENKKENFSEWYNEIVESAGLIDKRYPIKGMNIWMPYGLKVALNFDENVRRLCDAKGLNEVSFPLLITRKQLNVEFEHLKGFEKQVFWITKGGTDKLDEEMSLRPTSESAMYPMFAMWIRTHGDLPLKLYQLVSVYRYETKHTRPFLRDREFRFFEAHTAHRNYQEAEAEIVEYLDIWKSLSDILCVPYVLHRRPEWDKFAGAEYSNAADTFLPSNRSLQVATFHQYGTNFSKPYDITYVNEAGEKEYVHQTTYGMSSRLIGALVGIHGDDKGLILPPDLAPTQVIIIPIPSEKSDTLKYSMNLEKILSSKGIRARVDSRDSYTPGYKYNDWEMRGVPVRIEVGEREVAANTATIAMRVEKGKKTVGLKDLEDSVRDSLRRVKEIITDKAVKQMKKIIKEAAAMNDLIAWKGPSLSYWCGLRECSDHIEEKSEKVCLGYRIDVESAGNCVVCGKEGRLATFSRTY
ncbi:MAG: proline--tRNA ligase [Candidatus Thermoplasmatota archaeon]|jgi:prolyl-tRNA synthetase|nr:proline--tRNA ligase [Candidatus Thermoplasmatota archaeon]